MILILLLLLIWALVIFQSIGIFSSFIFSSRNITKRVHRASKSFLLCVGHTHQILTFILVSSQIDRSHSHNFPKQRSHRPQPQSQPYHQFLILFYFRSFLPLIFIVPPLCAHTPYAQVPREVLWAVVCHILFIYSSFFQVAQAPRGLLRAVTCHKRGACAWKGLRIFLNLPNSYLPLQPHHKIRFIKCTCIMFTKFIKFSNHIHSTLKRCDHRPTNQFPVISRNASQPQ